MRNLINKTLSFMYLQRKWRTRLVECLRNVSKSAKSIAEDPIRKTSIKDVWLASNKFNEPDKIQLSEAELLNKIPKLSEWCNGLFLVELPGKGTVKRNFFSGLKWPIYLQASRHVFVAKKGVVGVIVVDLRYNSPTYGVHEAFRLCADKCEQLLIPEGCAFAYHSLGQHSMIELWGKSADEYQFLKVLDIADPGLKIHKVDCISKDSTRPNGSVYAMFNDLTPWDCRISERKLTRGEKMIIYTADVVADSDYLIKPKGTEFVYDESCSRGVLHVREYAAFIQVLGKLKYLFASGEDVSSGSSMGIAFRGQTTGYGDHMIPSLYRGSSSPSELESREQFLAQKIKYAVGCYKQLEDLGNNNVVEALMQQYGVDTRWIDAVDNVWIALWFACYRAESCLQGRSVHYSRRDPDKEKDDYRYAYIVIFAYPDLSNKDAVQLKPGYMSKNGIEYIDLRLAVPSQFVRPHAQHGIMLRKISDDGSSITDYKSLVQAIIRIDLSDALRWLGMGESVSLGALFPSPLHDAGFQGLLRLENRAMLECPTMFSELKVKEAGGKREYKSLSFQRFDT